MTGVLQGCLLAMGITFEVRERRRRKMEGGGGGEDGDGDGANGHAVVGENGTGEADERTRLLDNGN